MRFQAAGGKLMVSAAQEAAARRARRLKVLIVDDSPTIRKLLTKILASDPRSTWLREWGTQMSGARY